MSSYRTFSFALLGLAAVTSLATGAVGCFLTDTETGSGLGDGECKKDSDCGDDLVCEDHECVESDWGGSGQGATTSGAGGATGATTSATGATTGATTSATTGATTSATGATTSSSTSIASSSTGGGPMCDNSGDCDTCGYCAQDNNCSDELADCGNNPECVAIIDCINACPPADATCGQTCVSDHPNGQTQLQLLITCINDECPNDCAQ